MTKTTLVAQILKLLQDGPKTMQDLKEATGRENHIIRGRLSELKTRKLMVKLDDNTYSFLPSQRQV